MQENMWNMFNNINQHCPCDSYNDCNTYLGHKSSHNRQRSFFDWWVYKKIIKELDGAPLKNNDVKRQPDLCTTV